MENEKNLKTLREAIFTLKMECEKHTFCRYCPLRTENGNCYVENKTPNQYRMASEPMCAPALFIEQEKK